LTITHLNIIIIHFHECDPKKCTGLKLARKNLAKVYSAHRKIKDKKIILNPYASKYLSKDDLEEIKKHGLIVVDCSWNKIEKKELSKNDVILILYLLHNPDYPYHIAKIFREMESKGEWNVQGTKCYLLQINYINY